MQIDKDFMEKYWEFDLKEKSRKWYLYAQPAARRQLKLTKFKIVPIS